MLKKKLHIITPVKDSLHTALQTIENIMKCSPKVDFEYSVYNDFSTPETTAELGKASAEYGFKLVNLADITNRPSPNYILVLQMAQKRALAEGADLLIIESDVLVADNTVAQLVDYSRNLTNAGLIASVTVDADSKVNFPYLYAKKYKLDVIDTEKRLSFCCTLLTNSLLSSYDFEELDPTKSWYDIFISRQSVKLGLTNYLLMNVPVLHLPHSSRPWKLLKYTNPIKYYWRKNFVKNFDKI